MNNQPSERIVLKTPEFGNNKTPRTWISQNESSSGGKRRKRNTINPACLSKDCSSLPSRYARNSKVNPRKLFTDNAEVHNSDAVRNIFRRSNSRIESKPKQKFISTRKDRQEKLLRLQNLKDRLETSSESCTSIKNSRCDLISNHTTSQRAGALRSIDYANIKNILNKNVQQSSFHLRSPKLRLNSNELNTSNPATDSPATVSSGNGFEIGSSELTSSNDVSFSVQRIRFEDNVHYHHFSDSLSNAYPCTCDDQIYHQPRIQQNSMLPWKLANDNTSNNGTTTFSDDGMSSVDYSPMNSDESPLTMIDNLSTSDVDVQMGDSKVLLTKSQNFIGDNYDDTGHKQLGFSLYSLREEGYQCLSSSNERSSPFKKRQMQWNTYLDPLESALTTSMEKLNEIISNL